MLRAMKRTLLTIALLTLFTFGSETQAEIKNKKVLMEIFVGCVEEDLQKIRSFENVFNGNKIMVEPR